MAPAAKRNALAICAFSFVIAACATSVDTVSGRLTLNQYRLDEEVEMGTRLATIVLAGHEAMGRAIDADDIYTRTIWSIASRIFASPENRARMPPLPWEVHVVAIDEADATCFPGGQIIVLAGLLRSGLVRDEDEAAALIAHEIAHGAARHATEQRTLQDIARRIAPLGSFFGPRLIALAHPETSEETRRFLAGEVQHFDRAQEIEADIVGLELMARAGFDPSAAERIWRRLASGEAHATTSNAHPSFEERWRQLAAHLDTARFVAKRSSKPAMSVKERWSWSDPMPPFGRSSTTSAALPFGPHVPSRWMYQRPHVLAIEARIITGEQGEAPRAALVVRAARDLVLDQLPFSAALEIQHEGRVLFARQLAFRSPLASKRTPIRIALPRLPRGRYRLSAWAAVGSLRAEIRRVFDVL